MNLTNFGIQFSSKVLTKTFQKALTPVITNSDYQGDIKKPGDRVRILSLPNDILLSDYVVGTDMDSETIVDLQEELVVEKRKYYNFPLDQVELMFSYGQDIPAKLTDNAALVLEKEIDRYNLENYVFAKAGSWIGVNLKVAGSGQTMASIATSATGGTVTLNASNNTYEGQIGGVENPVDGLVYFGGFEASDVGKGFRLRSTATFVSPWYRISAVTSSIVASITEWDTAVGGSDFAEGDTLRGLFGGDGVNFTRYGDGNAKLTTMSSLGWEIQAAIATTVTAASVYEAFTELAEAFNREEVPTDNLKVSVPPTLITMLKQATELQPTGIAEIYTGTVMNGRVGRIAGFEVLQAAGVRLSTRAGHSTAASATGPDADSVLTTGTTGWNVLANDPAFITYADKWTESRTKDQINQFATNYQGLYLFGSKVPLVRRKQGAVLFVGL